MLPGSAGSGLLVSGLGGRRLVVDGLGGRGILQGIVRPAVLVGLVVREAGLRRRLVLGGLHLRGARIAPDRAERLTFRAFHLFRIGAAAALQIEVFSYRVVKKTHAPQPTRR